MSIAIVGPSTRRRSRGALKSSSTSPPGGAVVVFGHDNLYFQGDTRLFLFGGFPSDQHRVGDRAAYNSILARCVDIGLATSGQIASVSVHTFHRVVWQRCEKGMGFLRQKAQPARPPAAALRAHAAG